MYARRRLITLIACVFMTSIASAADASGATFDLAAHKGKVVVVDFWASWCVPCRRSFPWMNEMQDKYGKDGFVVIGVNEDNSKQDAAEFLESFPPRFDIVWDSGGALAKEYDLLAMPSSYIFDRDGNLITRHLGFKAALTDEYEAVIRDALRRTATAANVATDFENTKESQQ